MAGPFHSSSGSPLMRSNVLLLLLLLLLGPSFRHRLAPAPLPAVLQAADERAAAKKVEKGEHGHTS